MNAPRMRSDLTSLNILARGQWSDLGTEIYGMSKAVLVSGAFALQCRLSVPPVTVAVSRCSHCSTHYRTPTVKYGTVQKSNLAKWRQDDVCCRRAIRRWKAETVAFPEMCGTAAAEQKKFIHTPVSPKSSVRSNRIQDTGCRMHFGSHVRNSGRELRSHGRLPQRGGRTAPQTH